MVTIPSIVVSQKTLLQGGVIWSGRVYNQAQSLARYVTIECFNFNPVEGTVGIDIEDEWTSTDGIGSRIGNKYTVKLI